jgi:hypothetical protein
MDILDKQFFGDSDNQIEIIIKGDSLGTPLTVQGITAGLFSKQPSIRLASSRGTIDDPKIVHNKDSLGVLKFNAYTEGKEDPFVNAAFIGAYVDDSSILQGKDLVEASLVLGSCSAISTEQFVTIGPDGTLISPKYKSVDREEKNSLIIKDGKIKVDYNSNDTPEWVGTEESFLNGTGGGCRYDYDAPLTINTKSTAVKITHQGNFKQPSLRIDSYDNNGTQASWMAFTRWRGTADDPQPCRNGDFIFAFDWLGKPCESQDWEWGMAQTAIVEGNPEQGFMPISMNWVTRDRPFGSPTCRVKISNDGKLYAYSGMSVDKSFDLNVEEVSIDEIDLSQPRYAKINFCGKDYAMPIYPIRK